MSLALLSEAQQCAARSGLNLFGIVDAARFDACQPKDRRVARVRPQCGTAVVLGSGGVPAARAPLCAERDVAQVAAVLEHARVPVHVVTPAERALSLARLAEAAGFGTISPVTGLLLHPEYGPWVQVRAALLVDGRPFGLVGDASITDRFQPCCSCRQPCRTVQPAADACPLGAAHRHAEPQLPNDRPAAALPLARWFGFAALRCLPRFLRR